MQCNLNKKNDKIIPLTYHLCEQEHNHDQQEYEKSKNSSSNDTIKHYLFDF